LLEESLPLYPSRVSGWRTPCRRPNVGSPFVEGGWVHVVPVLRRMEMKTSSAPRSRPGEIMEPHGTWGWRAVT